MSGHPMPMPDLGQQLGSRQSTSYRRDHFLEVPVHLCWPDRKKAPAMRTRSETVDLTGWNEHEAPAIKVRRFAGAIKHEITIQHVERLWLAVTVRRVLETWRLGGLAERPAASGLSGVGLAHD